MLCKNNINKQPPSPFKKALKSSHQYISKEKLPIGILCGILKIFGTEDKRNQGAPLPSPLKVLWEGVWERKEKKKKVTNTQTFVFPYHLELAGLWTSYCHFDSCMSHWVACPQRRFLMIQCKRLSRLGLPEWGVSVCLVGVAVATRWHEA